MHYENSFWLFLLHILRRMGMNWEAKCFSGSEETVGQDQETQEAPLLPLTFAFQHTPFFYPGHSPYHRDGICAIYA